MDCWNPTYLLTYSLSYYESQQSALRENNGKTQAGCLSKQELGDLYPSDEATCNLVVEDSRNNNGTRTTTKSGQVVKKKQQPLTEGPWVECKGGDCPSNRGCQCNKKEKTGVNMFSLQNCTLQSEETGNGESYWVSFEEKSFSKGRDFKVYSGRMNGSGPKSGEKCVVKVFRHVDGTENLCCSEIKKSQKAKELSRQFNSLVRDRKLRIKFSTVYWAQMDEVSKLKQMFFTGERRLTSGEAVLFEDDVRVNDEKPHKPRKPTLFLDSQGRNKQCVAKDLEMFAHFTYHASNGEAVVCGLDGVQDDDGFFLKTPTIHSRSAEFGHNDKGLKGIRDVFRNHVCGELCKNFLKPNESLSDSDGDEKDDVSVGKCSAASLSSTPPVSRMRDSRNFQSENLSPGLPTGHASFSWQEHTCGPFRRPASAGSQITEDMSEYLEPTAPTMEECNEMVFMPAPPPYSQMHVATWLLEQHERNIFLPHVVPENLAAEPVASQTSVDSGACVSASVPSSEPHLDDATFTDMDDSEMSEVSTTGCVYDCESIGRAASFFFDKKQVRFTLSNGGNSSVATSDIQVDTSTTTTSVSPYSRIRSILRRQGSAPSSGYGSMIIPACTAHSARPSCAVIGRSQTLPETSPFQDAYIQESPPSYYDSQLTTACWIMQRALPQNLSFNNTAMTDIGHSNNVASPQTPK